MLNLLIALTAAYRTFLLSFLVKLNIKLKHFSTFDISSSYEVKELKVKSPMYLYFQFSLYINLLIISERIGNVISNPIDSTNLSIKPRAN